MPRKVYIKIIGEHRNANENEFFPTNNPYNDSGMVELFEYLEARFNFTIEQIDDWEIKRTDGSHVRNAFGLRIVENDS
jgi:hypothetical protein|tara:strand:- start:443 stop:676 length:234 start_codon:yes stop_codon:yes gene_type:complete